MATKLKIRKGATVQIIAGSEKGKKGTVLEVNAAKMKVRVQGIRVQTHFDKKDGLQKKEGFLDYSNVKLIDGPSSEKKSSAKKKTKASDKKEAKKASA